MTRLHYALAFAALIVVAGLLLLFRSGPAQAQPEPRDQEEYRVELVQNDQYKVQKGLNSMARQGFYFVSSVPRNDGKVLLIFRKYAQ